MSSVEPSETRYAYLHGFASGPQALKGQWLAERLAGRGIKLHRPDLNRPSFAELTVTGALTAVDEMVAEGPAPSSGESRWSLVGSSFGGYVAARWAELHPERVERLLLLCPGFGLLDRWPEMLGEDAMARWQREGSMDFPDGAGRPTPVHWGFIEDFRRHPPTPEVPCPTRIIHGTRDDVVPIEGSRRYAATRRSDLAGVDLVEVDDDHGLHASLETLGREVNDFLIRPIEGKEE